VKVLLFGVGGVCEAIAFVARGCPCLEKKVLADDKLEVALVFKNSRENLVRERCFLT
jgi:hypothetical protein